MYNNLKGNTMFVWEAVTMIRDQGLPRYVKEGYGGNVDVSLWWDRLFDDRPMERLFGIEHWVGQEQIKEARAKAIDLSVRHALIAALVVDHTGRMPARVVKVREGWDCYLTDDEMVRLTFEHVRMYDV